MKVVLGLCLLLAVSFSQDAAGYDYDYSDSDSGYGYEESSPGNMIKEAIAEMTAGIDLDEILDDSTDSGLNKEMDAGLLGLKPDMCFPVEAECTNSMFLGCNCINGFKSHGGACAEIPCKIHTYIYNNLATIITELTTVESFKGMAEWYIDNIHVPLLAAVCDCQSALASSTVNCVQNYDGGLMMMMGEEAMSGFQAVMEKVDFETVELLLEDILGVQCVKSAGEFCYLNKDFIKSFVKMTEMVDKSFDDDADYCGSFKRVGEEFFAYSATLKQDWESAIMDYKPKQLSGMIQNVVKAWYELNQKSWCNEKCAKKLVKNFYTCCAYETHQLNSKPEMWERFKTVAQNLFAIISKGKQFPKIPNAVFNLLPKGSNPLKMCKINNSVKPYRRAKRKCISEEM